jgi:hypothetical protein
MVEANPAAVSSVSDSDVVTINVGASISSAQL